MTFIVVPWVDSGCPHRAAALAHVRAHWDREMPHAPVVIASCEPFAWGVALNRAIESLPDDATVLHSDPDSFVLGRQARAAVESAEQSPGLVVAFDRYLYLSEETTRAFYDTRTLDLDTTRDEVGVLATGVGNVTCYTRRTWEQAGGYDERFGTWGGADGAFAYCCASLVAPQRRVPGPMYHLWHPRLPESVPGGFGYAEQFAMVAEYRDAADAVAIRALIEARNPSSTRITAWTAFVEEMKH